AAGASGQLPDRTPAETPGRPAPAAAPPVAASLQIAVRGITLAVCEWLPRAAAIALWVTVSEVCPVRYRVVVLVLSLHVLFSSAPLQAADLPLAREGYSNALRAINRGQWTEYQQLRPALDDYPLA